MRPLDLGTAIRTHQATRPFALNQRAEQSLPNEPSQATAAAHQQRRGNRGMGRPAVRTISSGTDTSSSRAYKVTAMKRSDSTLPRSASEHSTSTAESAIPPVALPRSRNRRDSRLGSMPHHDSSTPPARKPEPNGSATCDSKSTTSRPPTSNGSTSASRSSARCSSQNPVAALRNVRQSLRPAGASS